MAQNISHLKRMVDLHPRIDSNPAVLVKVIPSLLPSSKEDPLVICAQC